MDMTLYEYSMYMEASELKMNDRRLELHEQAWAHQAAKATKGGKNPKPVYPTFDRFYYSTYQKNEKQIRERYNSELVAARKARDIKHAKDAGIELADLSILDNLNGKA